jgi:gamma-glutamyltranspeptidase/glutathione hydrolase
VTEAMRRAYRDRTFYLGDPDFVNDPGQRRLTRSGLRRGPARHHPSATRPRPATCCPAQPTPLEDEETTHFSIIDADGNRAGGHPDGEPAVRLGA